MAPQPRLTLVVLAAGIGRRFGGDKQLTAVGPAGEILLDYTVFDALRAGIPRVVLVIRPELETAFRSHVVPRFADRVDVSFAHQRIDDLPPRYAAPAGRTRPWGTGQAVLAAADQVDGAFIVTNADDYYGVTALQQLAAFLGDQPDGKAGTETTHALIGYALRDTLPARGSVSRAVCHTTAAGWLTDITEITGLTRTTDGAEYLHVLRGRQWLSGDSPVSMNAWGFRRTFFEELRRGFPLFLDTTREDATREYYLPGAVKDMLRAGRGRVRLLPATSAWCGMTHPEDRDAAACTLAGLVARGVYPEPLWK